MIFYSFTPINGLYLGYGSAQPSPEEPGVFLLPAFATFVEPPLCRENEIAIWRPTDHEWVKRWVAPIPKAPLKSRVAAAWKALTA